MFTALYVLNVGSIFPQVLILCRLRNLVSRSVLRRSHLHN
jgi:hypothetical protein